MRSMQKPKPRNALTLVEIVVAIAIMAVVFTVLLPQFRNIQNSWGSRQGGAEALQNGRVLIDHLQAHLAKAVRIEAVSLPTDNNGYIEFETADGEFRRYEYSDSRVLFGPTGNLSELAGPVGRLQFVCYGAHDLDAPTTDVDAIRIVRIETLLINAADAGLDKPFETLVYLRSNGPSGIIPGTASGFGATTGNAPALASIDAGHVLCAYTGQGDDGWAVVLTVDTRAQTVSGQTPFEYDPVAGVNPALAQIDATRFLCAYTGPQGDGWAVVLSVNPLTWTISAGEPTEFENKRCNFACLRRIDAAHFLCAYTGHGDDGFAVILQVDPQSMTVTSGPLFEFDDSTGLNPALERIDSNHFLCVYQGPSGWLHATVLDVDTHDLEISQSPAISIGLGYSSTPALARIDSTHYLCAYAGNASDGMAVVLTVRPFGWLWLITRAQPVQYDAQLGKIPALVQLADNTRYLCAYQGDLSRLWATVLVVDPSTWGVSYEHTTALSSWEALKPALARIDDYNYLCAHEDHVNTGWGLLLNVGGVRP